MILDGGWVVDGLNQQQWDVSKDIWRDMTNQLDMISGVSEIGAIDTHRFVTI